MLFSSWLPKQQRSDCGTRRCVHRQRITFRPTLEALENRVVPSTLMVTNNLDTGVKGDGSLRGEIAAAQSGDTIKFAGKLAGQPITLTKGELDITKNLDIEGLGATKLTVSGSTANPNRVFDISNNSTVTIAGLTIANGSDTADEVTNFGGGGILNEAGSTLTLNRDVLK